ncbi:MAG: ADP-ribosylation factor-like protein [Promethearchaeati archaeon SRVP18_Atabeyarchaeia-1]
MANECLADFVKKRRRIREKKKGIEEEIANQIKGSKEFEELKTALGEGSMEKAKSVLAHFANYAPSDYVTRISVQDVVSKKTLCKVGQAVSSLKPAIMELALPCDGSCILKVEASPAADVDSSFSVVWLGLEASGKSSLIERIRQDEFISPAPTIGLNVASSVLEGIKIVNCDLSGHKSFRSIWDSLIVGNPDILVYVIDGSEHSQLDEAQKLLTGYVLNTELLKGIPMLVVLSKQDVEGAIKGEQILANLNLPQLICDREWKLVQASAKTGEGISDMLGWMFEQIRLKKGVGSA